MVVESFFVFLARVMVFSSYVNNNTSFEHPLTEEEERDYLIKMKKGDKHAKEMLIKHNMRLVAHVVKKFSNAGEADDLISVGCIGLIKAINNFDLSHEVRFSTYAVPMIVGEVKRYLRDNNSVRISRSIKDLAFKTVKLKEVMTNKNGKEPTIEQLAKEMGVTEFEITHALTSLKDTVSMFEPIYNDGGDIIYLSDQLYNDEGYYNVDDKLSLKNALNKIKPKERYILTERYFVGKTQMELAEEIGISQAQISRLEKNGLENIKKLIK